MEVFQNIHTDPGSEKDGYTELVPNDIMKNPSETSVRVC